MSKAQNRSTGNKPAPCEKLSWTHVRSAVTSINPTLAAIIDDINPDSSYSFIKMRYPFGANLLDKGQFIATADAPHNLIDELAYGYSPIGFSLNKTTEIYLCTIDNRIVPIKTLKPGECFGLGALFDASQSVVVRPSCDWSISSGARSLFLLPKITHGASHRRLQRDFQLHAHLPDSLSDHWNIFSELAQSPDHQALWQNEVIYFSKSWMQAIQERLEFTPLHNYWLRQAYEQSSNWQSDIKFNVSWEAFIKELAKRRYKPTPYQLDTIRHLIQIGLGKMPGFMATDHTELIAPTKLLQDCYTQSYQLKTYIPTIMQPATLSPHGSVSSVYYSMQFPTLPQQPPQLKNTPSVLKELREQKRLMDIYQETLANTPARSHTPGFDLREHIQYHFFHNDEDTYEDILSTQHIPEFDSIFAQCPPEYGTREFTANAHFLRGCVRVSFTTNASER